MISLMIFSRNRTLQLYALLESLEKYFDSNDINVNILYRYDTEHVASLNEVMDRFSHFTFIEEKNFKDQVEEFLLSSNNLLAFLTDDIIFKDKVDINQISEIMTSNSNVMTFSLRLGLHIKDCYALDKAQPVPMGNVYPPNLFVWEWRNSEMDWGYPFSVDGHIFRKDQACQWFTGLNYSHPNSFEEIMQMCRDLPDVPPLVVSFVTSRLVNLPINRVQDTHTNRCGDIESDSLLDEWNNGLKINVSKFHQFLNTGVHQELPIDFEER